MTRLIAILTTPVPGAASPAAQALTMLAGVIGAVAIITIGMVL